MVGNRGNLRKIKGRNQNCCKWSRRQNQDGAEMKKKAELGSTHSFVIRCVQKWHGLSKV